MQKLRTGFFQLDKALGGLTKGSLTLLTARPGMGASEFALNILENLCIQEKKACLAFDLNLGIGFFQRLLCANAYVHFLNPFSVALSEEENERLRKSEQAFKNAKLHIEGGCYITPQEIRDKCALFLRLLGSLDFVLIDDLAGLREDDSLSKPTKTGYARILLSLQEIARDFNLSVLVVAYTKLNHKEGIQKKPVHLRALGVDFKNADVILFLQRLDCLATAKDLESGKITNGASELFVVKPEKRKTDAIPLHFFFSYGKFLEKQ